MYRIFLILLLLAGLSMDANAQRKAGRTAAAFLEIGVGAREVALGSAASSFVNDANQIFWNPAGTALTPDQRFSAALSYNDWIADLSYSAAAVGYNVGRTGTITVGVQMFGVSDIPANRENGYTDPQLQDLVTDTRTSSTFNFQDIAVSLGFSRYVVDRLALGAAVKLINESIDRESASAIGFDFGSVYHVGFSGWRIAARLSNLGSDMTYYNQENPLPLTFSIGSSIYPYNTEQMRVMLAVDATKPVDSQQLLYGGAEVSLYDLLFLRGGYKFNYSGVSDEGTAERDAIKTSIEGFSVGGGIQYVISDVAVAIDYAFTKMDLLNDAHRFTLRIGM